MHVSCPTSVSFSLIQQLNRYSSIFIPFSFFRFFLCKVFLSFLDRTLISSPHLYLFFRMVLSPWFGSMILVGKSWRKTDSCVQCNFWRMCIKTLFTLIWSILLCLVSSLLTHTQTHILSLTTYSNVFLRMVTNLSCTSLEPTGPKNPFQGAISFDNVGRAWTAIFLVISLEGWTEIMYYVQDAHSFWDWIYFVLLIVVSVSAFNTTLTVACQ